MSDGDIVVILTDLRSMYDQFLKPRKSHNYSHFSKSGTLAGTIEEVYMI